MTSLRVGGAEVGRYGWDEDPPPGAVARPAVHPLRTLAGVVLTDAHPEDHPWHRGVGLGLPDVDDVNLWGGPSYLPGTGYQDAGRGVVQQRYPRRVHADGVEDSLAWCDGSGAPLMYESRRVSAAPWADGWSLHWSSTLTVAAARDVVLASPGSHGRVGAGYGGFFWRLAPAGSDSGLRVFTPDAEGECAVNGVRASWLAVSSAGWTAVLAATDARTAADPWFVRVAEYAAVGSALAWDRPLVVSPDVPLRITLRLAIVDRACDRAGVHELLAAQ
jgi:hypothetical protein